MTSEAIAVINDPFTIECYDEYFTVFLTLVFRNLHEFDSNTRLPVSFNRIASKYHLENEMEFNREFKVAYEYIRDLLREAFVAYNDDHDVDHYKTLNDICENIDRYLDCFRSKFHAWLMFLNDVETIESYTGDAIIEKVIKLCELNKSLSKIKMFLSDELVYDELSNHDDTLESLKRYTKILYFQRASFQTPTLFDKKSISMNVKPGFVEFYKFICDKKNEKYFKHDHSFEDICDFMNVLNNGCFRYIVENLDDYKSIDRTQAMKKYEEIILSRHGLSKKIE